VRDVPDRLGPNWEIVIDPADFLDEDAIRRASAELILGVGRCAVCGRKHKSTKALSRCAEKLKKRLYDKCPRMRHSAPKLPYLFHVVTDLRPPSVELLSTYSTRLGDLIAFIGEDAYVKAYEEARGLYDRYRGTIDRSAAQLAMEIIRDAAGALGIGEDEAKSIMLSKAPNASLLPLLEIERLVRDREYGQIVSMAVRGPRGMALVSGRALAEEIALAVGFPDPYADLDQKRRGEALNYDLYVVMGNWYVIQKRTYWKSSAKRPPRVKKEYYATCVCMGRVELISEVHHSTVHAMVRKLHG